MGICTSCDSQPLHCHYNPREIYQSNAYSVRNYNETCCSNNIPEYYYPKKDYKLNNESCSSNLWSGDVPEYDYPPVANGKINHVVVSPTQSRNAYY